VLMNLTYYMMCVNDTGNVPGQNVIWEDVDNYLFIYEHGMRSCILLTCLTPTIIYTCNISCEKILFLHKTFFKQRKPFLYI
jgi:hypothetical protein